MSAKPALDMPYAILGAPVRHVIMMGVIWYLTRERKNPGLCVLEIGSWYGASALSWAQGLRLHNNARGSIVCVDAWEPFLADALHRGEVYRAMERALLDDEVYPVFLRNIGTMPPTIRCRPLRGRSEALLPRLEPGSFDVAFIDADHAYASVRRDIALAMPLVREGGILCGDDLNLQVAQVDVRAARKHANHDVAVDSRTGRNFHPGVTLAVDDLLGPVSAWAGFWAMQKQDSRWRNISLKGMPVHFPEHFPPEAVARARTHLADMGTLE